MPVHAGADEDDELELIDEEDGVGQEAGQEFVESQHCQLPFGQQIALSVHWGLVALLQMTETELVLEATDEARLETCDEEDCAADDMLEALEVCDAVELAAELELPAAHVCAKGAHKS